VWRDSTQQIKKDKIKDKRFYYTFSEFAIIEIMFEINWGVLSHQNMQKIKCGYSWKHVGDDDNEETLSTMITFSCGTVFFGQESWFFKRKYSSICRLKPHVPKGGSWI
jgi:hypothetical protein